MHFNNNNNNIIIISKMNSNQIATLPDTFGNLKSLKILYVFH